MIKKLLGGFIIVAAAVCYAINFNAVNTNLARWWAFSFCDRPISYKIGKIDDKFDITAEALKTNIALATEVWEKPSQKNLFDYADTGELTINLVYDARQQILANINKLDTKLTKEKQVLTDKNTEYAKTRAALMAQIEKLNNEIDYWNSKGGAPKQTYDNLVDQQQTLKDKIEELNGLGETINKKVEEINNEIYKLNENVNRFNNMITIRPEMGLYTSGVNKIDIYFYETKDELTHVLAHELGHSLGLDHVEEKDAIMNPIASDNTTATQVDIDALHLFCTNKNRFDLIKHDFQNYVYSLLVKYY